MGAENRGELFAQFIVRNYRKAKRVLCVADGKGQVARKLANKGVLCTIIEPKPRWDGKLHPSVNYIKDYFFAERNVSEFDLIVGMHPDEATSEIVLAAKRLLIPFAIVPCCIMGRHTYGVSTFSAWLVHLSKLYSKELRQTALKMSGKNTVLYTPANIS